MRSDILQAMAIVCQGNTLLREDRVNGSAEASDAGKVFDVHELAFFRTGTLTIHNGCLAIGLRPWVARLRKEGVERLGLTLMKCAAGTRPTESSGWGILTDGDVGVELWQPVWRPCVDRYSGQGSFRISYTSARYSRWQIRRFESQATIADNLRTAIDETIQTGLEQQRLSVDQIREFVRVATVWVDRFEPLCTDPLLRQTLKNAIVAISLAEEGTWEASEQELVNRLWAVAMDSLEAITAASTLLVH